MTRLWWLAGFAAELAALVIVGLGVLAAMALVDVR